MEYEFYLDIFFLTNFYLNLLSLFLTAAYLNRKCKLVRLGLAAAIGSFWNMILVLIPLYSFGTELLITLVVIGNLMLMIGFRGLYTERPLSLIRADGCLFLSAGVVSGCYSFLEQQFYLTDLESLVCTGLICVLLERMLRRVVIRRKRIGDDRYHVILSYKGREKRFLALADSGNRLCVPDSGKPVSLISFKDCKGFCEQVSGGFYIPYHAVGTEHGMLFAMPFERMEIRKQGTIKIIEQPVVAITKERLSVKGDFSMILPEVYIPEEE